MSHANARPPNETGVATASPVSRWLFICLLCAFMPVGAANEPIDEVIESLWARVIVHDADSKDASAELQQQGPGSVPVLLKHLEDTHWKDRWDAVNLLGMISDDRATDPLITRVLTDDNPHVRWRSLWALSTLNNPAIPDKFWYELHNHQNDTVKWNAVVGLAFFEDTRGLPYLEQGLSRDDSWERWEAIYCLRRIHGDETSSLLVGMLQTETEERMRREIVMALIHVDDALANATLVDLLDDPNSEIRWRAVMGLSRNHVDGARKLLEKRQNVETEDRVREELAKALAGLDATSLEPGK